jgi:hypothetical protein
MNPAIYVGFCSFNGDQQKGSVMKNTFVLAAAISLAALSSAQAAPKQQTLAKPIVIKQPTFAGTAGFAAKPQIVKPGGAGLVAAGGGNLVAAGGGNFKQNGAGLVAAGGGNFKPNGAGLVAAGGGNFRGR